MRYHALKVGSVEPLATASLWSVWALSTASTAARKSGRVSRAILPELISGQELLAEIERTAYVELFNRSAVVQQREQLQFWRCAD